jgi:hypothetical protein
VHAAGAAIHELPHLGLQRRFDHVAGALDVDLIVKGMGNVELPESGREMKDVLDAPHAPLDDGAVRHRPDDHFRPHRPERVALESVLVVERDDLVSRFAQPTDQCRSGEACATSD